MANRSMIKKDWTDAFSKASQKLNVVMEQVVEHIAYDLMRRVILNSPIDTGNFSRAWNLAVNTPQFITVEGQEGQKILPKLETPFTKIYLTNGLPYATTIEYGEYPGIGPKTVYGSNPETGAGIFSRRASAGVLHLSLSECYSQLKYVAGIST